MKAYKKAGARYFVTMGVHHDNFDLWDSKHQPRWNAVAMGPKRDIVAAFKQAARAEGLRFGISEHLWVTYKWFSISRDHDDKGPLAGVPYDGGSKDAADLYQTCPEVHRDVKWDESGISDAWKRHWFDRIKDLVDQHQPDLLYSDSWMPFGDIGTSLVAHLYNQDAKARGGRVEAVYTSKGAADCERGTCVYDVERGMVESIWPRPVELAHLRRQLALQARAALQVAEDRGRHARRRGQPQREPAAELPAALERDARRGRAGDHGRAGRVVRRERRGDLRHAARGRRSARARRPRPLAGDAKFNESARKALTSADVRYTTKGDALYAFVMAWPGARVVIPGLAPGGAERRPADRAGRARRGERRP